MKIYFVDAFTQQAFCGNPAAICFPDQVLHDDLMQNIAKEIGFSETAFVFPLEKNEFTIRYFSPKEEIPLCGHATLSAAKVLFSLVSDDNLVFITIGSIRLLVSKKDELIQMKFPTFPLQEKVVPASVYQALGIEHTVNTQYCKELNILLIELPHHEEVRRLTPDYHSLVKSYEGIRGICVTAIGTGTDYDFHYRFFWPWSGTEEDPVTGGVQTFLTPYWAAKLNQSKLIALQSSQRTGELHLEYHGDEVFIGGHAVLVLEGNFFI